jgi:hypothetical protein
MLSEECAQDVVEEEEDLRPRQEVEEEIAVRLGIPASRAVEAGLVSAAVIPSAMLTSASAVAGGAAALGVGRDSSLVGVDALAEALAAGMSPEARMAEEVAPPMPLETFKARSEAMVREFLSSQDFGEAERAVVELGAPFFRYELVKRVFLVALDGSDRDRELASRLVSQLYGRRLLSMEQVAKGFERVFENASELRIDFVSLDHVVGTFLARCVADEVLPPGFVADSIVAAMGGRIVDVARAALSQPHALQRLERCWGAAADTDVADLKRAVKMAVSEFFDTGDSDELQRCLVELRARHFMHEAVKRTLVFALERSDADRDRAVPLLRHLLDRGVLSDHSLLQGFRRVREDLSDIELDNPTARPKFDALLHDAIRENLLPPHVDLTPRYLVATS